MPTDETDLRYQVVVNDEEQYSIWPSYKQRPPGWRDTGPEGTKAECLSWIEQTWTDMRPRSLREAMRAEASAASSAGAASSEQPPAPPLADRLCRGEQRIVLARCSDASDFKAQLDRGYVLFEIPNTQGGTELGCAVSSTRPLGGEARFEEGAGKIEVCARTRLDFEPLEIRAVVNLATLDGMCGITRAPAL